jgi:hypothetical protein
MSLFRLPLLVPALALIVSAQETPSAPKPEAQAQTQRGGARLGSAAQRNENVAVQEIDTNVTKELNVRTGDNVSLVSEMPVEANFYASEHGQGSGEPLYLRPSARQANWHAELTEALQNSVFNARTFFQVGPVKPSHRNLYGGRVSGQLPWLGRVSLTANQRKIRGMVNGNVLAPLASERTPLASDPRVRALVERWMQAYPLEPPNRPDFDQRALNTNSPQRIDSTDGSLRAEPGVGKGRLVLSYFLSRLDQHAFELVAGQNPDSQIHTHRAGLTYDRPLSGGSTISVALGFQRVKSVLLPEPNAVGPRVRFGYQIEELGPDSQFPINRAQNGFRGGAIWRKNSGSHELTAGADLTRNQLNGIESSNQRGLFWFTNNFGRSAIDNFRYGTPSMYEVTVGDLGRGFRNTAGSAFFGDRWKATSRLQVYWGLRYGFETAPHEVNNLTAIPYGCDCHMFSPRLSLAWRVTDAWILRTAYTTSFGQVLPVTYQQARNNPPAVRYLQVQNPDFLNPLGSINLNDPNIRTSPTFLSPDLTAPYSHQYNFSLERRLGDRIFLRAGYIGSRTLKLLDSYQVNRADPVSGIPQTTATVDQRRADPRYYDLRWVVNAGIAYMDAAQLLVHMPAYKGLTWTASYTFGKAIDAGSDYTGTAANRDLQTGRAQSQYDASKDRKGLSLFDSTHAFQLSYAYDLPRLTSAGRMGWLLNGWQVAGVTLLKSGTPLTLYIGSDGPGFGNVDGGAGDRPNLLDPSILGKTISNPDVSTQILRRDRFSYLTPGQLAGTLGHGTFRKAPIANFNASLGKEWHGSAKREWTATLRGEVYNIANHPQFDEPQRNLSAPPFGKITNTLNDGRVLQISLRLSL